LSKNFVYDVLAHLSVNDVVALNNIFTKASIVSAAWCIALISQMVLIFSEVVVIISTEI